jgi:hypothetical protein
MDVSRSGPFLPDTTSVPHAGILRSLLFDPGSDLSHLHDLNQASNCAPVEEVFCNSVTGGLVLCKHRTEFSFLCFAFAFFILDFLFHFTFFRSSLYSAAGFRIYNYMQNCSSQRI